MTRSSEARFWQGVGAGIGVLGGFLFAYTLGRYGLASIDHRALQYGIASSFIMLAGAAAFLAGRTLHVGETGLTASEASLWMLLAGVCIIGGAATVVFAKVQHQALILDRLATRRAGAFSMMFGVMCLLGQRIMSHMQDALLGRKDEKAKGATVA